MSSKIQELHSLFKSCLDILRNDAEHLIGDESLKELSYFLILKQVEKHIVNGSIDIYNLELYKEGVKKYGNDKFLVNLEYVKFSKLLEYVKIPEKENNIKNIFDEFLWKEVLSKHPKFKDVFEDGKKTFIKESNTIKKLVIALGNVDFNDYDFDILGEAYESIFVDAVFGAGGNKKSELGQFFTPPKVKKLLVSLVNPKLKDNGEIESVLDPASGTGGILNTIIKHFKQFDITDAELRKQLIKNIYGIEIKGKIYNLCLSNMLINTGEILPNVICADSIRKFHNIKVDIITANPPFSVTIPYDDLISSLGSLDILNDYIPIKTGGKNSEVLFLQMMIHCLNINGRCSTVMLDGQKMYGTSSSYDKVREYLMKSCDLHEVILCPTGTFTSTASKTCILFFTKKKERKDVVELKVSGKKRTLTFVDSHSTKKVEFYNFDPDTEIKNFIKSINIDDIALKNYSLNYEDYDIEEEEIKKEDGIEWIILGEVCDFQNGKGLKKDTLIDGEYPVIGGGKKPLGYHNKYNRNENTILCSSSGAYSGYINKYKTKVWASDCFSINSKNTDIFIEQYLYYYLICIQSKIYRLQNGAGQPHVYSKDLEKIKIPIPSIEHQKEIIEFLDKLFTDEYNLQKVVKYYENNDIFTLLLGKKYDIFEKLVEWQEQSTILTKQLEFFKDRQARYLYLVKISENDIKTLGDVSTITYGTRIVKKDITIGDYPCYGGGDISFYINQYNREGFNILISRFALSKNCVRLLNSKFYLNDSGLTLQSNNTNIILDKYLAYYLYTHQSIIYNIARGTAQKNLDIEKFKELEIPIPSLERQQEIVNYCKNNDKLIKKLEQEIETNKEHATLFIKSIVKIQANPSEETDIEDTLDSEQE